ncbi:MULTISPECIES: histidinol-phosphate transaminase [unclassified Lentimonas]|uniref:histidinol-phosphate transaminase n=1 Tax=unclassified Lentimonas TaxID=2630993 RepID=UPI0013270D5F|nr:MULTISPECIES: histidinol-phosphate transaminase [unclassified Lentimonas]CAA6677303.1 Histidinol-phosphate aminotransferase (EC [Lentimonas sp. CC4]CAA6686848.1 Histidinol-phosphate aminotransferase (EC [Lentimonas sp. CC6]CAA7074549.1 Histidinol-phosphate aminotransferase (EC [Lentimonas sp. CC4]CAA7169165.1 Histidinol-phosphate aminotransferase (EC [Lentimonas sp. CC21]CAA7180434.1 Histidinol-phosphate aminotransferase (EC [Lentimonas sp. CC8]
MKKTFDANARALKHVQELHAYVPGEQPQGQGWVKLNTNENPYPPSPKVGEAVAAEVAQLRRYPEPVSQKLRAVIGARYGLTAKNVIIGNGSDNILDLITRCYVSSEGAGHMVPSYSLYPVVAGMSGQGTIDVPFTRSMELDVDAIVAANAPVFFLTSPNAPTGVAFPLATIETILQRIDGILVVDEAYVDFGGESAVALIQDYENLVVVRTFSKSYGLAGMRVGFGMASEGIIGMLDRVRDAYNVDRVAQAAAQAAFEDVAYFEEQRQKVIATREATLAQLDSLGWFTYPSAANLLFTEPKNAAGEVGADVAASLFEHLKRKRVLVRYFPNHPLTCSFLRVSIGTDAEMEAFITAVTSWLNHA